MILPNLRYLQICFYLLNIKCNPDFKMVFVRATNNLARFYQTSTKKTTVSHKIDYTISLGFFFTFLLSD